MPPLTFAIPATFSGGGATTLDTLCASEPEACMPTSLGGALPRSFEAAEPPALAGNCATRDTFWTPASEPAVTHAINPTIIQLMAAMPTSCKGREARAEEGGNGAIWPSRTGEPKLLWSALLVLYINTSASKGI